MGLNELLNGFGYVFIAMNVIGYGAMGIDKGLAQRQMYRISERALIGIAALFGSVGVYLGMRTFHHKTKKPKFYVGVPVIMVIQVAALWWFFQG